MKRNDSNLKYVILGENNFPRFSYVKRSFNRASRRRHVYKMHDRHAVEHDDGRLFITRELRKRSLSYSGWYIDVYLCYMRDGEKMLLRAAIDVSTRIQDAAATSVSVPGRHRSSISYDVQNKRHLSTSDNYIGDKSRTIFPVKKESVRFD